MAASKLKERRLALGLTQLDLAIKSGFSLTTVRYAELGYGKNLSARTKRSIAKALRTTVEKIFDMDKPVKLEPADGTPPLAQGL